MSLDEKPLEAIAKETHESSNEEKKGEREIQERNPTTPVKNLAKIICDREIIELKLRYPITDLRWEEYNEKSKLEILEKREGKKKIT